MNCIQINDNQAISIVNNKVIINAKRIGVVIMSVEIHNLLKIENDKTTIFTNQELKMIDDYIKELESYKYNMDRDYLRLEKENIKLKDNWNKLRETLKNEQFGRILYSYKKRFADIDEILLKIQELEKGE